MKNNKKGFTLAELLIVVAIIAVLVAIAVPVFVSALGKAEKATIDANERTLKGMAAVEIMSNDKMLYTKDESGALTSTTYKVWFVIGTYDSSNDKFEITSIMPSTEDATKKPSDWKESSKSGTKYSLYTIVTATELKDLEPTEFAGA